MDFIKEKISEVVDKIKADEDFAAKFNENPAQALESVVGANLPDDQINAIVDGVKAKLGLDKASGLFGKMKKKLF